MTKALLSLCIYFLVSIACNDKSTKETTTTTPDSLAKKENVIDTPSLNDTEKRKELLENMTPLSTAQMEKLPPVELSGAGRSELSSNTNLGTAMVVASYQPENNADLKLTIFDCAGPGGVGVFGTLYANLLDQEIIADDEYTKTVELNGRRVIEHGYNGLEKAYSLTWFSGNRFLVLLEGKDIKILRQAAGGLKIE